MGSVHFYERLCDIETYEHYSYRVRVSGALDFGMVGVIAEISHLLAEANISIFVISTYNTDYVFMKADKFDKGIHTLEQNGYVIKQVRWEV